MKKIKFLTLLILTLMAAPAFSQSCTETASSMCPAVPKVNGPVSAAFSKYTGMNAIIATTLESQVRRTVEGKFKSISAHSDTAYLDGLYMSNITAESLCGYNHFIYKNGQVYTNENFLLGFNADITSADLQKIISTPQYTKLLNSLNFSVGNMSLFKVFDPKAEIKYDRLVVSIKVSSPLTLNEPKLISTSMGINVENGKILFTDIKTTPSMTSVNMNSILPVINKLNPLVINTAILNNPKSMIKINDINISGDKIVIKGLVIVPKNYYNN